MKRPMLQGTLGGAESHPNPCKLRNESFAARASDEPPFLVNTVIIALKEMLKRRT